MNASPSQFGDMKGSIKEMQAIVAQHGRLIDQMRNTGKAPPGVKAGRPHLGAITHKVSTQGRRRGRRSREVVSGDDDGGVLDDDDGGGVLDDDGEDPLDLDADDGDDDDDLNNGNDQVTDKVQVVHKRPVVTDQAEPVVIKEVTERIVLPKKQVSERIIPIENTDEDELQRSVERTADDDGDHEYVGRGEDHVEDGGDLDELTDDDDGVDIDDDDGNNLLHLKRRGGKAVVVKRTVASRRRAAAARGTAR